MFDLTWPEAAFTLLLFLLVTIPLGLPRLGDLIGDFLYGYRGGSRPAAAPVQPKASHDGDGAPRDPGSSDAT